MKYNIAIHIVFLMETFPLSAAMALSGYPSRYYSESTNVKVPASPNLRLIINETNNQLINNFMNHLFHVQEEFFKVRKKLRPLLECMFATLIMYHTTLLNKFGQTHIITLAVTRSAREFSVSERMLEEWGNTIRFDWELRNSKLQSNNEENKILMESIINNNAELLKSNKQQMKEITAIREEMSVLRTTVEKFEGIFKDIRQHLVGSPSKKRKTEVVSFSSFHIDIIIIHDNIISHFFHFEQMSGMDSDAFNPEDITQSSSSSTKAVTGGVSTSNTSPLIEQLKPGVAPFRILTMKGLYLRSILYSRYYYNLTCEASWVVETGSSSTQDKSRIVNIILPFIMNHCTDDDKAVLTTLKPDSSSPEYDVWNNSLLTRTAEIEKRLEAYLEQEEDVCFPDRNKKKLRRKHMSVNGVEGRLAEIKKARRNSDSTTISSIVPAVDIASNHVTSDKLVNASSSDAISSNNTTSKKQGSDVADIKRQQNIMSAFIRK